MPKFSIIMPTYNHEKFIDTAIKSVISQTIKDFELIIINNFSTDNTLKIIKNFQDKRIKVINFNNSGVIASSRNEGIKKSKGKYIAFLDSDDYWSKNKLETSLYYLDKGYDFICHKMSQNHLNEIDKNKLFKPLLELTLEKIVFRGNLIFTSSVVIKKTILQRVNLFCNSKKIVTAEDFHLWLKILSCGYKCYMIPEKLGYNRLHDKNTSQNIFWSLKVGIRVLLKIKLRMNENNILNDKKKFKKSLATIYYGNGLKGIKLKNNFHLLSFLGKALKYDRLNLKYILVYIYYNIKRILNFCFI